MFRYCGEYFDTETGTIYLRARYYNPTTGRFISRDSVTGELSNPLSLNLYTYCTNNPILYFDPSGHKFSIKGLAKGVANGWCDFWEGAGEKAFDAKEKAKDYTIDKFQSLTKSGKLDFVIEKTICAKKDSAGIYHISQNCWQQFMGYNKGYDFVFDKATKFSGSTMKPNIFDFKANNATYALWAWKGDYINLGAGCEIGIYKQLPNIAGYSNPLWSAQPKLAMPMTLDLKYKGGVNNNANIFSYTPTENQWWVNGFNPQFNDNNASYMTMTATVDFSNQSSLWKGFQSEWDYPGSLWTFDDDNKIATLTW